MRRIFAPDSPYTKQARFLAVLWTLLIFIGCFTPGKELPRVDVPFFDKWTHLVMFGLFTFLWLCAYPVISSRLFFRLFLIATVLGGLIELLQGYFTALGRSMDIMDAIADSVGAVLGIALFYCCASIAKKAA